jgi:Uma2 family endonuclease
MSAVKEPRHRYTYEEYLAYERDAATKHEYFDGEIYVMAGGSPRHSALAARFTIAIGPHLPSGCEVFQSDLKVRVLATGRVAYPDVSLICGPLDRDPQDPRRETVTNPTLLMEVLSRSTEEIDRISKRHDYQLIPTLREYVLVSQDQPRIEIYRRQSSGEWEYIDVREGSVTLAAGPTLDLEKLYKNLPE